MIVIAFGDVQPHEVGKVNQIIQGLRLPVCPVEPVLVKVEPPKLLSAVAGELPGGGGGEEKCGARNAECGVEGDSGHSRAEAQRRGVGSESNRPVNVNVVVNNATVTGEKSGTGLPKDIAETIGQSVAAMDTIRKHTQLLPGILDKVESTPLRTAVLLKEGSRQKLRVFGTVVEDGFSASAHFTNLTWGDKQYVIRRSAAMIIQALYMVLKSYGLPGFTQDEVFAQVYGSDRRNWPSGNVRIQNFFRRGDAKRLWDDGLIAHDGKGNFHLNVKIHT
jgi:hypothetical protein